MSRAKLPVVAAGTDWAPVLGGRLGRRPGDLSHHAVEVTRNRLRLALVCFVIVFSVLAGRLTQLTILQGKPAWHSSAQSKMPLRGLPLLTAMGLFWRRKFRPSRLAPMPRKSQMAKLWRSA